MPDIFWVEPKEHERSMGVVQWCFVGNHVRGLISLSHGPDSDYRVSAGSNSNEFHGTLEEAKAYLAVLVRMEG
jgi:hypothetical protein